MKSSVSARKTRSLQAVRLADRRLVRAGGFTLIELMVALALSVLILFSLTLAFSRNSSSQNELERTTRRIESARFALDVLIEDILHAGYYGEVNPDLLSPASSNPDPCATVLANLGWITPAGPAVPTVPAAIRGVDASESLACLGNRLAGTEAIALRHLDTGNPTPLAGIAAGNLYVQTTRCSADITQIVASGAAADFILRDLSCAAPIDSVRRYVARTYYIAACNDCSGGGDGIPTLKRVELVDGALRTTSMAEGIENLQVQYGIDTDNDGRPNSFVAAAAVPDWKDVVAARVNLLARSTEPTQGYTDPRTYVLGSVSGAVTVAPADAYKRTLMTSTVRLVNVGGRREL